MNKKSCVFCGQSPPTVKISKEHVMRSALRKYHAPVIAHCTWNQNFLPEGERELIKRNRTIPMDAFDFVVNDVCKTCNEGWLNNDIEIPAEPFLASALLGNNLTITPSIGKALALWAAKTAAVRALIDPLPHAIPKTHYVHIKENLEPPPHTFVWLAHTEYAFNPSMRHTRLGMKDSLVGIINTSHFTSIIYGHMALYIIGASESLGLSIYDQTIAQIEERDTIQIWPAQRSTNWPTGQLPLNVARMLTSFVPSPGHNSESLELVQIE